MNEQERKLMDDMFNYIADLVSGDRWPWEEAILTVDQQGRGEELLNRLNILRGRMTEDEAKALRDERQAEIDAWNVQQAS